MRPCMSRKSGRILDTMSDTMTAEKRDDDDQEPREGDVLVEGQDDAPDPHDGRRDHEREAHEGQHLDLLDVVGRPGDERRRTETPELALGELLHPTENLPPQVAPESHGGPRPKIDGAHRTGQLHGRHRQHHAAGTENVRCVPLDHAVIDDLGVERGEVESGDGGKQLQHDDGRDRPPVRTEVGAKQPDQHEAP